MTTVAIAKTLVDYIIGLQHIGHVVEDLDAAVAAFCALYGVAEADIRYEPPKGVEVEGLPTRFAFVQVADAEFELIEPVSDDMKSRLLGMPSGLAGINHVAWRVRDIEDCMRVLGHQGIKPGHVTPDGIARFGKKSILYLDPTTTGNIVVELIEIED